MREAFPWDEAQRFVLRDRDAIYERDFAAMTEIWEWRKCLRHRDPLGKIHLWRDWWALSVASVWTTLSCGTRDRCDELCTTILPTISGHERI
jgi:hypothetical protein